MSDEETGPGSYEKIRTHDRYLPSTAEHRSMFEDENLYEGYPLVISLASGRKTRYEKLTYMSHLACSFSCLMLLSFV